MQFELEHRLRNLSDLFPNNFLSDWRRSGNLKNNIYNQWLDSWGSLNNAISLSHMSYLKIFGTKMVIAATKETQLEFFKDLQVKILKSGPKQNLKLY